ncbi:trimeric intracellular cation channel family protein [Flammeovirga sp. SR4]|uniref:Trimeric intracellular cation channel family protein n=1 Tax=Flammeovirga agarivorans TaxID=2726742 RepID=A0A7X8SP93_9BACT|nr:trimeric intracellular cation channel family protein [Flammeovirga agarivorans]
MIYYIGVVGTFAFGISGALVAMNKRLDAFGVVIVAFVTSVGGGTLRDTLIEGRDVFWIDDPTYIYFIIGGAITAMVFQERLELLRKHLMLFDTIGLGLFTIAGVQVGLNYNLSYSICIILGVITGAFGGVSRDILVNEIPYIFHKEIYATISILGSAIFLVMHYFGFGDGLYQLIPISIIILLRLLVVSREITLPSLYTDLKRKKKTE